MKEIIKKLEELADREVENNRLKDEIKELKKMLNIGFDTKLNDYDRASKLFSIADEKRIKKFYDSFSNQIKSMAISKDFEKFAEYLKINHGISITVNDDFPRINYNKSKKKLDKFYDIYSTYFIDDVPKNPKDALDRISKSLYNIYKEYKKEEEPLKEDLKSIIESDNEHSPLIIKTLNKIIKQAKVKEEKLEDVASGVEDKLTEQLKAITIIEGN